MHKFSILGFIFFLFGCSGSDDNVPVQSVNSINPPVWIHGIWLNEESLNAGVTSGFKLTSNDFCTILFTSANCYNEQPLDIEETSTNNAYDITLSGAGSSTSYKFIKVSSTQINVLNLSGEVANTYKKQ